MDSVTLVGDDGVPLMLSLIAKLFSGFCSTVEPNWV
jgi:hypothetical protein